MSSAAPEVANYQDLPQVEPAGIEPATSCLQSRSRCPLVSVRVHQIPANEDFRDGKTGSRDDGGRQPEAPQMHPRTSGFGRRERELLTCPRSPQLVAAELLCTVALASAIAVSASTRGLSSNSSITWP
jgi:hypothetical protein